MTKVITYGTFDLLHRGHIRLLERASQLGDYLIVGVTADDFDEARGKVNVRQSLSERMEAIRATGLADEVIVEEYEGQKIDDIQRMGVDIFTVGSDWRGKFDYLSRYCKVVYLERTAGVSSTELRSSLGIKLGLVGDTPFMTKYLRESRFVNGMEVVGACASTLDEHLVGLEGSSVEAVGFETLLSMIDAAYIATEPARRSGDVARALSAGVHVLCESPIATSVEERDRLFELARRNGLVLMEAIRPASCTAFNRLCRIIEGGAIGKVLSVDAVCTSMRDYCSGFSPSATWGSVYEWAPTALLPIFNLLGTDYRDIQFVSHFDDGGEIDLFTRIALTYDDGVASAAMARGAKSEGSLVVTGTEGYAFVPAPWWKTDYFELRFEDASNNRRFFWQLDGEGIRGQLVRLASAIEGRDSGFAVSETTSRGIAKTLENYFFGKGTARI